MSQEISNLERKILRFIFEDNHRASAIQKALSGQEERYTHNDIVAALNSLEENDLVERYSSKSWIATGDAEDYLE
jgi:DNA-binding MarR family transcriptional regulator